MRLTFLGATQTVTGSKSLLQVGSTRVLVDCGLFQGHKELKDRNWATLAVDPGTIDAVILTHAHLDHSGYLPLLVKNGFKGPVYCTPATRDLCEILLLDSGHLLERDADFANRHGYSKHKPALALYTVADAQAALGLLRPVEFGKRFSAGAEVTAQFWPAGHILGAAMVQVTHEGTSVLFSGDLGRAGDPIMLEPAQPPASDYLVVESTYGDRRHEKLDPAQKLGGIITKTAARGGTVLVPAFAVGRAQSLLYYLHRLKSAGRMPQIAIFLDSPMAVSASDIFCRHLGDHKLTEAECSSMCAVARYVRSAEDSKALDHSAVPAVIISASGMATGGRVLHHLKVMAPDPRNTILLAGFQAAGTRGAQLMNGTKDLSIHGQRVLVRASVEAMHMLSAHADADEIIEWLGGFHHPPKCTFVTHGEAKAADCLSARISTELGWTSSVPSYAQAMEIS